MDLDDADKPCSSRQQSYSINSSETPSTTNMSICTVCGDVGNGLHYGVISCRSCNAFFRRSVKDEKAKRYVCRGSGSCVIELKSRCACRFCRFYKCLVVGMSIDAVQHPRDPNGTQSNRVNDIYIQQKESNPSSNSDLRHANRNANLEMTHSNDSLSAQIAREESLSGILAYYGKYFSDTIIRPIVVSNIPSNILSNVTVTDGSTINVLSSKKTIQGLGDSMPSTSKIHNRQGNENINFGQNDDQRKKSFSGNMGNVEKTRLQLMAMKEPISEGIGTYATYHYTNHLPPGCSTLGSEITKPSGKDNCDDEVQNMQHSCKTFGGFKMLLLCFEESNRLVQLYVTNTSDFIKEKEPTFREFNPSDVDNLAGAELNGLSYMCEKMEPWKHFCVKERDILFKRFSVRKLALDHAYFASKHTQLIEENKFAMINYTYLSETATGFEKIGDSEEILKRKKTILRPTIDRMLNKCVKPMNKLNMKSAEILAMHVMLMWSQSNEQFFDRNSFSKIQTDLRDWALNSLVQWYTENKVMNFKARLKQIKILLAEMEIICENHCHDIYTYKMFKYFDKDQHWYQKICYSDINKKKSTLEKHKLNHTI